MKFKKRKNGTKIEGENEITAEVYFWTSQFCLFCYEIALDEQTKIEDTTKIRKNVNVKIKKVNIK